MPRSRSAVASKRQEDTLARDEDATSLTPPDPAPRTLRLARPLGRVRRLLVAIALVPIVAGIVGVPAAGPVAGDELADAQAQQRALERKIAEQKVLIARLDRSQASLQRQIASTGRELNGITADLQATRKQVDGLEVDIAAVQRSYDSLVSTLERLDVHLASIETQEADKAAQLVARKAQLASRIRDAYDAERTSLLETLLSGASFTDVLAEMSYQLDIAEQDKALAEQIARDRETLAALHETVVATRAATDDLRVETGRQKEQLDQRLEELKKAQAKLAALEKATKRALAAQQASYAGLQRDEAALRKAMATASSERKKLQKKIDEIIAAQYALGNIPSAYNGTLRWPMQGAISQEFGCTGFSWEPAKGSCSHFHNGIDIVAAYGTPVKAAGPGRVVYVGWNYADGYDPAWIVIIAHSQSLTTWYGHLQARFASGVRAGAVVSAGQTIGWEGNTGHSTGAHLHWMVELRGDFVNPRLFV
jgi:murein DD-endopeptidase MepM/ murein hydrolase activator NlpD